MNGHRLDQRHMLAVILHDGPGNTAGEQTELSV